MKYYAVWIDHAKALIVKVVDGDVIVEHLQSGVEPHHNPGEPDGEHVLISNQKRNDNIRHNEMKAFVKTIIKSLENANEIHILGPGNAKFELKKGIEEEKSLKGKLKSCETSDKMTENQLVAKVKKSCGMA